METYTYIPILLPLPCVALVLESVGPFLGMVLIYIADQDLGEVPAPDYLHFGMEVYA